MNKQLNKRRVIPVAIALMAVVALSGVAYAYWTVGGGGSGTANAAPGVNPVSVHQVTPLALMYPGDTQQTISGDFANSNTAAVYVTSVTASIGSVTPVACAPDNFLIGGVANGTQTVLVGALVAPAAGPPYTGSWTGIHIQFNNKLDTLQDECKSAVVTIAYSSL